MTQVTIGNLKSYQTDSIAQKTTQSPQFVGQQLQNFLLIWLDADLNESREDVKKSIEELQSIVLLITIFSNVDECVDFLSEIGQEKIFLVVSYSFGRELILNIEINKWQQIDHIYIFSNDEIPHEYWITNIPKLRGAYTEIDSICKVLETDCYTSDRANIPVSFNGIDPLFMYTQFLKEAFLEIDDDNKNSISEFAEYCRTKDVSKTTIEKFEKEYPQPSPIWWYTGPFFIYSMLNRGLRQKDVDIILKMGFFIRTLHNNLQYLHEEQQSLNTQITASFQVYRAQGLSLEDFDKMKKSEGNFMSFNNFLSTSFDRQIAFGYAQPGAFHTEPMGILFVMTIKPETCRESNIPFASVKNIGHFKNEEDEMLFGTHTIFRIDKIQHIKDHHSDAVWEVNLTLVGIQHYQLNPLISYLKNQFNELQGWSRLGEILLRIGEFTKAESLFHSLLKNATSVHDHLKCYSNLALVYYYMGDYQKANVCIEETLNHQKRTLSPLHSSLALSYNNIGSVYSHMGEYLKALLSYERSLEICKTALPPNHFDLATCYNNIGSVYYDMGEYLKALSSYKRSLEICKTALPSNHPHFATCCNNIGCVYSDMGEYSKALSSYERSLEICKTALPPNHLYLANSYNNIGCVYQNMGEYSIALLSCESALEVRRKSLPTNHPDLAVSYNNIGLVYYNMGEYSKALSSYERSLEIRQTALPTNHPVLATSYNNIGSVYSHMGEHLKALSSYERSLQIRQTALPPNHPNLATSYNNIASVYFHMRKYSKALSFSERSLEIWKTALPPNHPNIATSYNNIGDVYHAMGEHSKALSFYKRGLEIKKIALPPNHPDLTSSYKTIGNLYFHIGEYSEARLYLEKAYESSGESHFEITDKYLTSFYDHF